MARSNDGLDDVVDAAIRAANIRGVSVADVPLSAVAEAARMSRSTLLRRLGGKRAALDAAVAARGIHVDRTPHVRERAIAAAALAIRKSGLGSVTLEDVAREAHCSVPSLHAVFKTRDGLLAAVFDFYGPLRELPANGLQSSSSPKDTVRAIYHAFVSAFERNPHVLRALFADLLSRPDGPASRLLTRRMPRAMRAIESLLRSAVPTRRVQLAVQIELLLGPLFFHQLFSPVMTGASERARLSGGAYVELLTEAFLRAIR